MQWKSEGAHCNSAFSISPSRSWKQFLFLHQEQEVPTPSPWWARLCVLTWRKHTNALHLFLRARGAREWSLTAVRLWCAGMEIPAALRQGPGTYRRYLSPSCSERARLSRTHTAPHNRKDTSANKVGLGGGTMRTQQATDVQENVPLTSHTHTHGTQTMKQKSVQICVSRRMFIWSYCKKRSQHTHTFRVS